MPAGFKRASSVFLDSPVKPGNDKIGDGDVVIIMRPLIINASSGILYPEKII
jgi:hypothetical protein